MKRWLCFSLVLVVGALAASLVVYSNSEAWLPVRVPTHWGLDGQPDVWTNRDSMLPHLLMMPGVALMILALACVLPSLSPEKFKVDSFRSVYGFIMFLMIAMLVYLHAAILTAYMQTIGDVTRWLAGGIFLGMASLGPVLSKVRPNFWMGVRTPLDADE